MRRRVGGLKGASISDFNGKDGAITLVEGQCSCLVCCCVYVTLVINTVSVSLNIFLFYDHMGHVHPCLRDQIHFTLM